MQHALISDSYANLPALDPVLRDIDAWSGVGASYHLGDLVGYAPWPNETVALLRERGIAGIAGNYDEIVRVDYDVEKTAHAIIESDLPNDFADYLRSGGKVPVTLSAGSSGTKA